MTSTPPQNNPLSQPGAGNPQNVAQAPLASAATDRPVLSYASATKNRSAPNASDADTMSAAVGGPPSVQHGHGDSVNGRNPTLPAVPAVPAPGMMNGGNGLDHARTPSMTFSPAGTTAATGGAGPGTQNKVGIQFGSINANSPGLGTPPPLANHPATLGVASLNPRVSPQNSPSPIPQPVSASGGRPPSTFQAQGNGMSFGALGGETNDPSALMRSTPQMPLGPQQEHMRRGSSQSMHSEMSNGGIPAQGRGGYQQGSRGRGGYAGSYNQPMSYSPSNSFRPPPNGRGMQHGFPGRQQGPFGPGSPGLATRTPMSGNPGTPQMNSMHMVPGMQGQYNGYVGPHQVTRHFPPSSQKVSRGDPAKIRARGTPRGGHGKGRGRGVHEDGFVPSRDPASERYEPFPAVPFPAPHAVADISPESGNFEQFLTQREQGYGAPLQSDHSIQAMYSQHWMQQPQMQGQYTAYPPNSPRHQYMGAPQAPYLQPTQSNQGHPPSMSRQSSQMSMPDRPASSIGQPSTPSVAPAAVQPHPTIRAPATAPVNPTFIVPPKKKNALAIKNAAGEVLTLGKPAAAPAAPATPANARVATPPVPTPSPRNDAPHSRTDSVSVKTDEEKKKAMQDAVARKVAEDEAKAKQLPHETPPAGPPARKPEATEDDSSDDPEEGTAGNESAETREEKALDSTVETEPAITTGEPEQASGSAEAATSTSAPEESPKVEAAAPAGKDEIDYDAMEAEFAAQEAEELRREEEYRKKKEAQKEAERLREAAEEAAYEANMKQAEREAEEREEAKAKKKAEDSDEDTKKEFEALKSHDTPTPSGVESPAIETPEASGAATPVSDVSMPPPARNMATGKRGKVAELTLNTTKTVEPPEPSATLRSLKSARLLDDPTKIDYPSGIASPNPALNANAPADRKFKYNKEFLLQFQNVFKEKPSLDWDAKIREAIGDGGDGSTPGRSSAARTSAGMGSRSVSNRGPVGGFSGTMGAFGAPGPPRAGPSALPAGTTSEQRFALSNAAGMANARNPMASNLFAGGRPGLGLPNMGTGMVRQGSNNPLGMIPQSPRGGGSGRGGRQESKRNKIGSKQQADQDRSMPLTANMDLGPIQVSASGWKPRSLAGPAAAGPALGGDGLMAPDVVQRKVKSNLNKMTPEKFDKIADQILEIAAQSEKESDGRTLRQVIALTFEKATDEAHWASMYAMFCKRMLESMSNEIKDENVKDKNGQIVTGGNLFRKYLLNRCQEEFEQGWKVNLPDKPEGVTEEAAMLSDEYYIAATAKRRGLGLVKFIGELFKLGMLTERIMHECVKKLLDYEGIPDEAEVESLTSLMRTVGANLDDPASKAQPRMDAYFERINQIMNMPGLPSRLRFMLLDVIDLRRKGWRSKDTDKGPKTIQEIHLEAEVAARAAEAARLVSQANRGGGRMSAGRGDARNFSGGYGQMPPPDNSNRLGTDDLRRLGRGAARNASNMGGAGFGPPSLLSGRQGSGRKGLGPGGSLLVSREHSGDSSRTGTPPQKDKEKKDESSTNAFSALAALESHEGPASPPTADSPPIPKSRPNIDRERSKSPDKRTE